MCLLGRGRNIKLRMHVEERDLLNWSSCSGTSAYETQTRRRSSCLHLDSIGARLQLVKAGVSQQEHAGTSALCRNAVFTQFFVRQ